MKRSPRMTMSQQLLATMLLAFALLATGCTYERVIRDDMDTWRAMATPNPAAGLATPTQPTFDSGWAIELAVFTGRHRQSAAQRLVDHLKHEAQLQDVWIYNQDRESHVLRGRYDDPNALDAQTGLYDTRQLVIQEARHFENAQMFPFGQASRSASASVTAADLKQFTGMAGYSLQVAFFDAAGGPRFREAAEAYCRQLREKEEQAYYYHGPNRSLVTVGLFTEDDLVADGFVKRYGPRIQAVQERFPHNLGNGATILEKAGDQMLGEQASTLIHLPRQ